LGGTSHSLSESTGFKIVVISCSAVTISIYLLSLGHHRIVFQYTWSFPDLQFQKRKNWKECRSTLMLEGNFEVWPREISKPAVNMMVPYQFCPLFTLKMESNLMKVARMLLTIPLRDRCIRRNTSHIPSTRTKFPRTPIWAGIALQHPSVSLILNPFTIKRNNSPHYTATKTTDPSHSSESVPTY
jgi:hypothetical protein